MGVRGIVDAATITPLPYTINDVGGHEIYTLSASSGATVIVYANELEPSEVPDRLSREFTNRLSATTDLQVNKVWWDDTGDEKFKRPDISFILSRQSTQFPLQAEVVIKTMKIWETRVSVVNSWWWICNLQLSQV